MGQTSAISWTDGTYNPWRGCEKISEGCKNCYAEEMSHRNPAALGQWGGDKPRTVGAGPYFGTPAKMERAAVRDGQRRRLFTCSVADFFEDFDGPMIDTRGQILHVAPSGKWVTEYSSPTNLQGFRPLSMDDVREKVFGQIAETPHVDWQILTKRADMIMPIIRRIAGSQETLCGAGRELARKWAAGTFPENVWVGVSAENQQRLWQRAEHLRLVPAAVRWLSVEPMLADIDIAPWCDGRVERDRGYGFYRHADDCPYPWTCRHRCQLPGGPMVPEPDAFHWVVIGGESGRPGAARECSLNWIRRLAEQCRRFGVAVFVKQLGSMPTANADSDLIQLGGLTCPKGQLMHEWPEDLRVQEFPMVDVIES